MRGVTPLGQILRRTHAIIVGAVLIFLFCPVASHVNGHELSVEASHPYANPKMGQPSGGGLDVRQWHLDEKGNIYDSNHVVMGRLEGDGSIVARDGTIVGHMSRDLFTDGGGQVRATLSEDGALYNDMGSLLAWVSPHDRISAAFILFSPQLVAHRRHG